MHISVRPVPSPGEGDLKKKRRLGGDGVLSWRLISINSTLQFYSHGQRRPTKRRRLLQLRYLLNTLSHPLAGPTSQTCLTALCDQVSFASSYILFHPFIFPTVCSWNGLPPDDAFYDVMSLLSMRFLCLWLSTGAPRTFSWHCII